MQSFTFDHEFQSPLSLFHIYTNLSITVPISHSLFLSFTFTIAHNRYVKTTVPGIELDMEAGKRALRCTCAFLSSH
jgi:hypothetical protein